MKKTAPLLALLLALLATAPSPAVEILTVDEVRPGMQATALTVWEGATVEPFPLEIVGLLRHTAPGRHLILAEAKGPRVEAFGVPGGISGSPVYVDGQLVGACAFTWSFAKRPLLGIQPIEYMLDLMVREESARASAAPGARPAAAHRILDLPPFDPAALHALRDGGEPVFMEPLRRLLRSRRIGGGLAPLPLSLSVSGVPAEALEPLRPTLAELGLTPVAAGRGPAGAAGVDGSGGADTRLKPGAAVGAALVRGDLRMDAFGTVTHVAGEHVFAFGHPFFSMGSVEFPMSEGWVQTVLPRHSMSFKLVGHVRDVGAVRQDRDAGLYGRLGEAPRMLPLDLELERGDGAVERLHLEMIRDPALTPLLAWVSLQSLLTAAEREIGSATIELGEGSVLSVAGHGEVSLRNLFAGPNAAWEAAGSVASALAWVLNNEFETPGVESVTLKLRYHEELRTAAIRRVQFGRASARPGETVPVEILLQPWRGEPVRETVELRVPDEVSRGTLTLAVGSAAAVDRLTPIPRGASLTSLDGLLRLIHGMRRNATLYVQLSRPDESLLVGGEFLPHLPPTMESLLRSERVQGERSVFDRSELVEEELPLAWRLTGIQRATLEILPD